MVTAPPEPRPHDRPGRDVVTVLPGAREVRRGDAVVPLTRMEHDLWVFLLVKRDVVHTREAILRAVWGWASPDASRTVDTHVARLRRKLGPAGAAITTVHRVGYLLRSTDLRLIEGSGWTQVFPRCVPPGSTPSVPGAPMATVTP
ncbi:winged helix family transcriptional regulator [Xylanimonas allomyrinae]|uniref:Winged helix family transcriptional regulator n=1 Tax=Xylanimonas allomyrinae TaxID=2509459 RepID=A0A4P6EP95_9MICO|nr:winged helix-turn-helix domain-containing protein [Xylanimonas allomyrinae]QAY64584.1 winged helix family transcriptional regulator [Xylanimonas allomyrinae]